MGFVVLFIILSSTFEPPYDDDNYYYYCCISILYNHDSIIALTFIFSASLFIDIYKSRLFNFKRCYRIHFNFFVLKYLNFKIFLVHHLLVIYYILETNTCIQLPMLIFNDHQCTNPYPLHTNTTTSTPTPPLHHSTNTTILTSTTPTPP